MTLPKDPIKAEETRKKMSAARIGMVFSDEHKQHLRDARKDRPPLSKESRLRLSLSLKGRVVTNETRRKISIGNSGSKGKHLSEETKQKMSDVRKGRRPSEKTLLMAIAANTGAKRTVESRIRMSLAHKGKTPTKEQRDKLRVANTGHIVTEETRRKIRERQLDNCWYGNVPEHDYIKYCEKFNESLKERVRAYFGYRCFECGVLQNGKKLSVHHVHYNKKTCCDGSPSDLIPLCPSCHNATNTNRDYWEDHFTELLYASDPNGKCFFTKEEIKLYKSFGVGVPHTANL
jgi:hypothetical protein